MEMLDPHNIGYIMVNFRDNDLKTDKFSTILVTYITSCGDFKTD